MVIFAIRGCCWFNHSTCCCKSAERGDLVGGKDVSLVTWWKLGKSKGVKQDFSITSHLLWDRAFCLNQIYCKMCLTYFQFTPHRFLGFSPNCDLFRSCSHRIVGALVLSTPGISLAPPSHF